MSMEALRETFFQECEDLIESMADGLRQLDEGAGDPEVINLVFRAVHSIKGGAGAFGLDALVQFAHGFETTLDGLRSGKIEADPGLARLLMQAGDHLSDLVASARAGRPADIAGSERLLEELEQAAGGPAEEEEISFTPMALDFGGEDSAARAFSLDLPGLEAPGLAGAGQDAPPTTALPKPASQEPTSQLNASQAEKTWEIRFRPGNGLYANGHDPALLFRDLERLGTLEVLLHTPALVPLADLDWQHSYIGWSLRLTTGHRRDEIEEIFDFVEGLCRLDIAEAPPGPSTFPPPGPFSCFTGRTELPPAPADPATAAAGIAEPPGLPAAPAPAQPGSLAGAGGSTPAPRPEPVAAAASPGAPPGRSGPKSEPGRGETTRTENGRPRPTIRVDLDRVDRLINVVGELVINQAMLAEAIQGTGLGGIGSDVGMGLDELKQLSREIQEGVMAIRAQPVKPLFDRMYRIVRESAEASGKSARLVIAGESTEVDKTVVEKLADPLTHMIRNAVDHGLEPPERRLRAGKPEEGVVRLAAQHRSGRVIITLEDDGGGIDRPRVREIAVQRGLIAADADLGPAEIDNLLFLPGFSTARELSKLSGRGVGLDVVKSAIAELGGRVSIQSTPGTGSIFSISLPLTLAVLDGMIVRVAGQQLVVPITAIVETLRPGSGGIQSLGRLDHVMAVRGAYVPVVDIGAHLGFRAPLDSLDSTVIVLIEGDHDSRVALAVDQIQDQRQVVIKSLEGNYGQVPGIAAATVLGDGRIALILDTNSLAVPAILPPPMAAE